MVECILCGVQNESRGPLVQLPGNQEKYSHVECAIKGFAFNNEMLNLFSFNDIYLKKENREREINIRIGGERLSIKKSEYIAFLYELLAHYLPIGLTKKSTKMINERFLPLLINKTGVIKTNLLDHKEKDFVSDTQQIAKVEHHYSNDLNTSEEDLNQEIKTYQKKNTKIDKYAYRKMKPENKVIGQQKAKSLMLRLIHRFDQNKNSEMDLIQNALFYGPTGTGKTLLLRTMCKRLGVNFYELDASQLTQTGYVGMSISEALLSFIQQDGKEAVENSIIYIDEIDKLASKSSFGNDVGTIAVQNELLKLLEGGEYQLQNRNESGKANNFVLKTNNIMFIASGSFREIIRIVKRRLTVSHASQSRGYSSIANLLPVAKIYDAITEGDFIKFGLKDEFLGRFQQKVPFFPLTQKEQCEVLKLEASVLEEYKELFKTLDIELIFEEGAIESIVASNQYLETGCRGLQRHVREILDEPYALLLESDIDGKYLVYDEKGEYAFSETYSPIKEEIEKELQKNSLSYHEKNYSKVMPIKGELLSAEKERELDQEVYQAKVQTLWSKEQKKIRKM